jgi:hypothetical protein
MLATVQETYYLPHIYYFFLLVRGVVLVNQEEKQKRTGYAPRRQGAARQQPAWGLATHGCVAAKPRPETDWQKWTTGIIPVLHIPFQKETIAIGNCTNHQPI